MKEKIHNRVGSKGTRTKLRNRLTPAEARLWLLLRKSQVEGKKFRRQHGVGPYVLDFYCPSERLCIELDGTAHYTEGGYEYDATRTAYLEALNIRVIRFENKDVFDNAEGVVATIRKHLASGSPPVSEGVARSPGGKWKMH